MLVFINACRLLSALPSLSQFDRGRLSLVAISLYALLLLFAPRHLSEFTLAGPLLLLPAALEVQIYEVNFFCVSVTPYNFILHQNRIFCINDVKMQPRLNTG